MSPKIQIKSENASQVNASWFKPLHSIIEVLPILNCQTPVEILNLITENNPFPDNICPLMFDAQILNSDLIQRPCQYLRVLDLVDNFERFTYPGRQIGVKDCLEILIKHVENTSPNWSELINFCSFLNAQLIDCENSIFCDIQLTGDLLPGFKNFVIKFMIQMSHDFAVRSLDISDSSALKMNANNKAEFQLDQLKMRRKWENDPHPYIFFNPDRQTFTFFGFNVDLASGKLVDPKNGQVLFDGKLSLTRELIQGITRQNDRVLKEDIAKLSKNEKIHKLLMVMGVDWAIKNGIAMNQLIDPDPSYELTMDNLLKIIAIYMRLRANIPVIIMGETGCGKTR